MDATTHHRLRSWYAEHGRTSLPWRTTSDPYAIYISEVMLQQTQVQTVLDRYYFPFLRRFPTLQALADAPLEDVLKAWEGLGYYSRARNLHHAAKTAAPVLPITIEGLMSLKGIGRNTAHAIAAFAYHLPVAVMEANVKRVIHRVTANPALSEKELWEIAHAWVDKEDPFSYNQAMMDIGATICTPRAPKCLLCPLSESCQGKDSPLLYSSPKVKKATPVRYARIIVPVKGTRYYLTPRTSQFLGGLYGFPEYSDTSSPLIEGHPPPLHTSLSQIGNLIQTYSHFQLQADVYLWHFTHPSLGNHWYDMTEINTLPLSRVDSKVVALLQKNKGSYK
jgi:A/G-specific adenine glycosylase